MWDFEADGTAYDTNDYRIMPLIPVTTQRTQFFLFPDPWRSTHSTTEVSGGPILYDEGVKRLGRAKIQRYLDVTVVRNTAERVR